MNLEWIIENIPSFPNLSTLPRGTGVGRLATILYGTILGPLMGHSPGGADDADIESLARVQKSRGCGAPSPWKFDRTNHINRTIGDRSFYVHIPPSYKPNTAHAVVLSFHGYKGSDLNQEAISAFSQKGLTVNRKVGSDTMDPYSQPLTLCWIWGRAL